jgi:hypothetical protein
LAINFPLIDWPLLSDNNSLKLVIRRSEGELRSMTYESDSPDAGDNRNAEHQDTPQIRDLKYKTTMMAQAGVALILLGCGIQLVAYFMNVGVELPADAGTLGSVADHAVNVEKVSMREMIALTGAFGFLSGIVLYSASRICASLVDVALSGMLRP